MKPRFAVIDSNTPAAVGMKQLLHNVIPVAEIETFGSLAELEANQPETIAHFFVAFNIFLENRNYFQEHSRKTIVLTATAAADNQLPGFNTLCVNQPERQIMGALMALQRKGHPHGHHQYEQATAQQQSLLTDREIQVLALIVQGYINKQIAEKLDIALTTVITHRKNIMEKLGMKSVSALTIYAVMHGYVDINKI